MYMCSSAHSTIQHDIYPSHQMYIHIYIDMYNSATNANQLLQPPAPTDLLLQESRCSSTSGTFVGPAIPIHCTLHGTTTATKFNTTIMV